jgi:hypothetical protein
MSSSTRADFQLMPTLWALRPIMLKLLDHKLSWRVGNLSEPKVIIEQILVGKISHKRFQRYAHVTLALV